MSVRLVVTITAFPGKGTELARIYRERCAEVMKEPGCEQFEVFQSVLNPDRLSVAVESQTTRQLPSHAPSIPAGLLCVLTGCTTSEDGTKKACMELMRHMTFATGFKAPSYRLLGEPPAPVRRN